MNKCGEMGKSENKGEPVMIIQFISVLLLGLILGIKHSLEPDHIIAVSTIVSKDKRLSRSTLAGAFWGIGHTATLFVFGILIVLLKGELADKWVMSLEFIVGIMLVYLGSKNLLFYTNRNVKQPTERTSLIKVTLIGIIHGLAGSAAMVLLTMSTVSTVWQCALYILVFGIGTIIGMLIFTTIIGIPFVYSSKSITTNKLLVRFAGSVSLAFGVYYMYSIGITDGLFELWIK